MTRILILIIKFYKYFISPLLGSRCRFMPTCSEYFIEALNIHGLAKGFTLGIKRIFKCHPFKKLGGAYGVDFVPIPKNIFKQKRLKRIVEELQRASLKIEDHRESKNG